MPVDGLDCARGRARDACGWARETCGRALWSSGNGRGWARDHRDDVSRWLRSGSGWGRFDTWSSTSAGG